MSAFDLRCATWNIHRAKGQDGRVDLDRIHTAIEQEIAGIALDLLALQEADEECRPHARLLDMERLATETGLIYMHNEDRLRWGPKSDGFLGTIVFLHPRFEITHRDVLDLPGHCHRGAVSIEAMYLGTPFRVMSMHLSLSQPLRIVQMRIVGQFLRRRPAMQTILLGDFNEWRPWGGLMFNANLLGRRFHGTARSTFPSRYPFLPLDRIMTDRAGSIEDVSVLRSPVLQIASDHLPLSANVKIASICE